MIEKKPFEIARETLKQLTTKKLAPTPLNYQRIYCEVAKLPLEPLFPTERLSDIAQALPAKTPGQQKQLGLLESAITQLNWEGVKNALMAYGGFSPAASEPAKPLGASRVDSSAAHQADCVPPASSVEAPALTADFFLQIARLIEFILPALDCADARFTEQSQQLLTALRQPEPDAIEVKRLLANYGHRLSFAAEDQLEIRSMLHKLLQLIIDNIGQLSLDDCWLKGQIDALALACAPPLSLRRLDDVERRLKDVLFKQTEAKSHAMQAQEEMRQMLATFIERLVAMSESTSEFHAKMQASAKLVEQAKSISDIAPVMKELVSATRHMALDSQAAHDELLGLRNRSQATQAELTRLHRELDRVSAQARHDPLTGALNRQGLDEATDREVAKFKRTQSELCVALLDIDNFKKLNDALGHTTGDIALAHLATVTRDVMRPQDSLARYGGEEFVLLLPDTPLDKGVEAMTRLQRELTKRFFLSGNDKVLITFSAGVAQLLPEESGQDAIKRADRAMYLAKRAGKNRVLAA